MSSRPPFELEAAGVPCGCRGCSCQISKKHPSRKHLYKRRISESSNTQRFARPAAATTNGELRVTGPTPSLHRLSRLIIWRARSCHLQCTRPVAAKNKRRRRLADRAHILGTIDLFETEMYVAEHTSSLSEAWLVLLQTFMRVVVYDGTICAVDQCSAAFFFILSFMTKDKKQRARIAFVAAEILKMFLPDTPKSGVYLARIYSCSPRVMCGPSMRGIQGRGFK